MSLRGILVTLSFTGVLVASLIYWAVPVPSEINQRDEVFWIFAKRRLIRQLSVLGDMVGIDSKVNLQRSLSASRLLTVGEPANYTDVKVSTNWFRGVPVRIHDPDNRVPNSPAFVYLHGGGWVHGSAEGDEFFTTELARRLNILIVSVNYMLAPEFPFPAALDDCFEAVDHFLNNAKSFDIDPKRVAIGGSSAGGNLAAAVSLRLRDEKTEFRPSILVLIVPCLQAFDFNTPSYQQNADSAFLSKAWMIDYWLWYALGGNGPGRAGEFAANLHTSVSAKTSAAAGRVDHGLISRKFIPVSYTPNSADTGNETLWNEIKSVFLNPYFAPLMADNLTDLPETYIATAEWDVLRDDGLMFARRLGSDGGVDVEHNHYEKGYHALFSNPATFATSRRFLSDLCLYLSRRL